MSWSVIFAAMGIPSAITAFCFWLLEHKMQKREETRQKEIERRDKQRREYELCQLNMTAASMALAEATAQAVQRIPDAHCNGDMEAALQYAEKIKAEQKDFLRRQAVDSLDF